jgi:hypothetical protein
MHNRAMVASWTRVAFRAEDLALAMWNLVAVPVGAAIGGSWLGDGPAPLLGAVEALAIVGVVIALDARPRTIEGFQAWAMAGPLIGAVTLVGGDASQRLGFSVAPLGVAAFVAGTAAFILSDRLPVLPEWKRRLAVAPFILITSAFFTSFIAEILDGLDLVAIAGAVFEGSSTSPEATDVAWFVLFALVSASLAFYAMLIIAPRELAAPEPLARVWLLRYLVFAASAILGAAGYVIL